MILDVNEKYSVIVSQPEKNTAGSWKALVVIQKKDTLNIIESFYSKGNSLETVIKI